MGRDDGSQFWHFLRRAAIIRQFEGLEAINALIAANTGNFGVLLLRPAFEELAWIEYLTKHPDIASDLLLRMTQHEVATSLAAQFKYAGEEQMREGGFTPRIFAQWLFSGAVARGVIRKIGAPLDWKTGRKILPSMSHTAKQVGREDEYKFLYHGTSRYVHFSTQELGRRVWGRKGEVRISSEAFRRYWIHFAMSWSSRMFLDLLITCVVDDLDDVDASLMNEVHEAQQLLTQFVGKVPIITIGELQFWPAEPS